MSDEYLSGESVDQDHLAALIQAGVGANQALIISAYLEEKQKWVEKKQELQDRFNHTIIKYKEIYGSQVQDGRWKKFFYHKILRKPTSTERRIERVIQNMDTAAAQLLEHENAEPNSTMYEIASLGDKLFKPR